MARRKTFTRRLARGGSIGAGFLLRTLVAGAALGWLLDRDEGPERRRRLLAWVRGLLARARGKARQPAPGRPVVPAAEVVAREAEGGAVANHDGG